MRRSSYSSHPPGFGSGEHIVSRAVTAYESVAPISEVCDNQKRRYVSPEFKQEAACLMFGHNDAVAGAATKSGAGDLL